MAAKADRGINVSTVFHDIKHIRRLLEQNRNVEHSFQTLQAVTGKHCFKSPGVNLFRISYSIPLRLIPYLYFVKLSDDNHFSINAGILPERNRNKHSALPV